jgi:Cof subfamily protein (haloacid dehalogenase superfamily)
MKGIISMIKLVATDLDGTLVRDGYHTLNPRVNELIIELKKKGITFVAASGRQYTSMRTLFRDVKEDVIFVAENGSYVVCRDFELDEHHMDKALVKELMDDIRSLEGCFLAASVKDKLYVENPDDDFLDLLVNGYKNEVAVVDKIPVDDLGIIKVSAYKKSGIDDVAQDMIDKWGNKLRSNIAGGRWLDFMDKTVDKGEAIAKIQEILGIGIEETMVFGDNHNDLGMFKRAKESYAVANAREEVKKAAKHITDTNLNGGVIKVLETLI